MASHTFLIIEDSPTMRQLIRFALNRIPGAEVVEAVPADVQMYACPYCEKPVPEGKTPCPGCGKTIYW